MKRDLSHVGAVVFLFFLAASSGAARPAGDPVISFARATILTPDGKLNAGLKNGSIQPSAVVDVRMTGEGLIVNPLLRHGWTWLIARGIMVNGAPLSFVFSDGRLYSDVMLKTLHRRMKFLKDVSSSVRGGSEIVAFYRENVIERELVIFAYRARGGSDSLTVENGIFGQVKKVPVHYRRNGLGFVGVLRMADEFRPWFVEHDGLPVRERRSLDRGWKFHKGDLRHGFSRPLPDVPWEDVDVPHCWNGTDVFDGRNVFDGFEVNNGYYRGPGWYRKEFVLDEGDRGKRVHVSFEGAFQKTDVWLNGRSLGTHKGGYTGFTFDITDALAGGKQPNVLAVRVDNTFDYDIPPHTADYAMYGGLYRDVYLTLTGRIAIEGDVTAIPTVIGGTTGEVSVRATIANTTGKRETVEVTGTLVNEGHEIVASFGQELELPAGLQSHVRLSGSRITGLELWSPERPALYTLHTRILSEGALLDEVRTRIGFRSFSFHPDSGFVLNGVPLKLKGVNRHQEYPMLGIALPDSLHVRDMSMIRELGANFVRLAHYPQDPSVLDACDSLGILVWEEIPIVNSVGGEEFAANARTMMREMIERDRNHPSIILWGMANECLTDYAESGAIPRVTSLLKGLHALAKELDPTRSTTQAHNDLIDQSVADITDVMGRNRYFGWYTPRMEDLATELDREHRENPRRVLLISEYGAESKRGYHVDRPVLFDHSEEYQLKFHEYYWDVIRSRPFVSGSTVWTAFDFCSPFKIGNIPRVNQKGIWDAWRKPKDLYFFYKSQWSTDPMVYIVSHTRSEYHGKTGSDQEITVFSNCESVELYVNGESAGKLANRSIFRWNTNLRKGENSLRAIGWARGVAIQDSLQIRYSSN